MRDCESKGDDNRGPNVCELVMKSSKDRDREEGELETSVESRDSGSLTKRREIGMDLNA